VTALTATDLDTASFITAYLNSRRQISSKQISQRIQFKRIA
jgi:hypothetical protein